MKEGEKSSSFFVEKLSENNYFYLKSLNKMGCSCKNKVNPKYTDGVDVNDIREGGFLTKIGNYIVQLLFGLIVCVIMTICVIPFLAYVFVNICIGRKTLIRIPNLTKIGKKE